MNAGDRPTTRTLSGVPPPRTTVQVHSGGTMWRLRSLVAMGHDARRIASALGTGQKTVEEVLRGETKTISVQLRDLACDLWDAWWDKHPPERTSGERRAAAVARCRAERNGWCPPLALDEDELDEPGYRPYARYRVATGTGVAAEFRPHAVRRGGRGSV